MRTRFIIFALVLSGITAQAMAATDEFDFNNFAITETGDADLTTGDVTLNAGANPITVSNFDIAGIMLGMSFDDLEALFIKTKSGLYSPREKDAVVYSIQKEWKYNLDYECRQQGIVVPDELKQCVYTLARDRGLLYASELHLVRENTGETIDVFFTSNADDNVVWRILYNNDVNEIEGAHEKFADQREKKILAFWQSVLDKYGAGSLDLVDMGRYTSDIAENIQSARENFQAKPYAF